MLISCARRALSNKSRGRGIFLLLVVLALVVAAIGTDSHANDSAAEVTPVGLVYKFEKRISIERETLFISATQIEVTYEFKNHSDKDIATEIAFPVPEYKWSEFRVIPSFRSFKVLVNGTELVSKRDVKALLNGKDYTEILNNMKITIDDFGGFEDGWKPSRDSSYYLKASREDQDTLTKLGLIDPDSGFPLWAASVKYHWAQVFPAKSSVTIRHSYSPYYGYEPYRYPGKWKSPDWDQSDEENWSFLKKDACLDKKTERRLDKFVRSEEGYVYSTWITYILTTANNWKQPIKQFDLLIETSSGGSISLCFGAGLRQISENLYKGTVKNFIPTKDLKVYFFNKPN
jgi:hypothetical protein